MKPVLSLRRSKPHHPIFPEAHAPRTAPTYGAHGPSNGKDAALHALLPSSIPHADFFQQPAGRDHLKGKAAFHPNNAPLTANCPSPLSYRQAGNATQRSKGSLGDLVKLFAWTLAPLQPFLCKGSRPHLLIFTLPTTASLSSHKAP